MMTSVALKTTMKERLITDRESVFTELYQEVYPKVLRFVLQRQGSAEEAKDIFHDGLIVLFERTMNGTLEINSDPVGYLVGTCKNLWFQHRRDAMRLEKVLDDLPVDETEDQSVPDPAKYLQLLGEKCRNVLHAFYYLGQPLQEIASRFNFSSVRSATVQKFKCMEQLRKQANSHLNQENL